MKQCVLSDLAFCDLFKFVDTKYPQLPAMIREKKEITPEIDEMLSKAIAECKAQR